MLRFSDIRFDGSSIKELSDGSIKVTGQLTRAGIFTYRNPDGTQRREYRPASEVFNKAALETFAGAPVTLNHPGVNAQGMRLVTADTWRRDAIGHMGENIRQDGDSVVGDFYIRDAAAVRGVKSGTLKHVSMGYQVDYDATPGTTPEGERFDGVQRNHRGNHVALLPMGVAPRGGENCALRLDSSGDEVLGQEEPPINPTVANPDTEALSAQITALKGELTTARTDAAEVPALRATVADLTAKFTAATAEVSPERLDALVEARQAVCAAATAAGVDPKGKPALQIKREIIAKRTPALAVRVDSYSAETVDAVLATYAEAPHPSMAVLGANVAAPAAVATVRTDAAPALPTISELHARSRKNAADDWKSGGDLSKGKN